MPHKAPCPDCDRTQPTLTAATAQRGYAARRLCGVCGYPLQLLTWPQWAATGYHLDIRDEFRLLADMEGQDDAIAA